MTTIITLAFFVAGLCAAFELGRSIGYRDGAHEERARAVKLAQEVGHWETLLVERGEASVWGIYREIARVIKGEDDVQ